jgi:hypothetical protein
MLIVSVLLYVYYKQLILITPIFRFAGNWLNNW